jgi:hypothetical protein
MPLRELPEVFAKVPAAHQKQENAPIDEDFPGEHDRHCNTALPFGEGVVQASHHGKLG